MSSIPALLDLEREPGDLPLIHRVFRAIHTIKGSGATAGFGHLARFAHQIEEAFDLARAGRLTVTPELIDCGLKSCDVIRLIMEQDDDDIVTGESEITAAFLRFLPDSKAAVSKPSPAAHKPTSRTAYQITIRPHRNIFYSGADPAKLLDDLREIGLTHVTAIVDGIPPFASLDPEHCFLWWKVLFVTEFDSNTVKDVFEFVEDDCDISIRLLDNQTESIALLGAVPAEAFEAFKVESEEHLERIENDTLAIEENLEARDNLDSLFRGIHSIKGNAGLLLGQVSGEQLNSQHPLQLLFSVAHKLESLLDPFRSLDAASISYDVIQTTLETCDAIRTLLGSLTHNGAGGDVSPELLRRLGVQVEAPADELRSAAFRNTTSQCLEMIAGCFARLRDNTQPPATIFQTYLRGLRTLSAAAQYQNFPGVEEPVARQLRILDAAVTNGEALGESDQACLSDAFKAVCSALDGPQRLRLPPARQPLIWLLKLMRPTNPNLSRRLLLCASIRRNLTA